MHVVFNNNEDTDSGSRYPSRMLIPNTGWEISDSNSFSGKWIKLLN